MDGSAAPGYVCSRRRRTDMRDRAPAAFIGDQPANPHPAGADGVCTVFRTVRRAQLLADLGRPETLTLRQVAREVGVAPASI